MNPQSTETTVPVQTANVALKSWVQQAPPPAFPPIPPVFTASFRDHSQVAWEFPVQELDFDAVVAYAHVSEDVDMDAEDHQSLRTLHDDQSMEWPSYDAIPPTPVRSSGLTITIPVPGGPCKPPRTGTSLSHDEEHSVVPPRRLQFGDDDDMFEGAASIAPSPPGAPHPVTRAFYRVAQALEDELEEPLSPCELQFEDPEPAVPVASKNPDNGWSRWDWGTSDAARVNLAAQVFPPSQASNQRVPPGAPRKAPRPQSLHQDRAMAGVFVQQRLFL